MGFKARPSRTVSATEAAKGFGRLVNRVREERTSYIVERDGVQVARLVPVDVPAATIRDLKTILSSRGRSDSDYAQAVEDAIRQRNVPRVRRNPWAR